LEYNATLSAALQAFLQKPLQYLVGLALSIGLVNARLSQCHLHKPHVFTKTSC